MKIPNHTVSKRVSRREQEILDLISDEYTITEISCALFISPHTVVSHRKNLMHKLNARNTAGLIRRGFELKLLDVKIKTQLI